MLLAENVSPSVEIVTLRAEDHFWCLVLLE